ncbi:MAG: Cof-type HAD-IIB family hydrolase [Erysipelotrichaceae bacterium]|nr:Cof-type HAD-IIB family hydrolase [Erysipelotrichaceae bacterium]
MVRLFATDVDHTLYDAKRNCISKRNIEAIKKMQDKGIYVVLASSRVLQGMKVIVNELALEKPLEYMIVNNGAELYEVKDYQLFLDHPFAMEDLELLEAFSKNHNVNFSICQDTFTLTTGIDSSISYDFLNVGIDLHWVHDITKKVVKPVYRCAFTGDKETIVLLEKEIKTLYGDRYFFNIPHPGYLDVSLLTVNKANAIMEIANRLGISKEEIACIGDGNNDVPMLKLAGISGCVGNGSALAKESATYVVDSCEEDGFAKFVETYILGE